MMLNGPFRSWLVALVAVCGALILCAAPLSADEFRRGGSFEGLTGASQYQPYSPDAGSGQAFSARNAYRLGTGDKIRITVFGEPDLSGEFIVSSTGTISMPLIGELDAKSTVSSLQERIRGELADGYLKNPRVSLEVLNYRPFFILGEVMKPGSYPYVSEMTIVNAVALAGGYTYRANKKRITLKRGENAEPVPVDEATSVLPGDVIEVPQRYF